MTLEELITKSENPAYYTHATKNLTEEQLKNFTSYANELSQSGASDPLSWAYSEAKEGIAQRARYYLLSELFKLSEDISLASSDADYFNPQQGETLEKIEGAIGQDELTQFLQAYGKSLINGVVNILDDSNYGLGRVGWEIRELDQDSASTGRPISGLHEDWLDFRT